MRNIETISRIVIEDGENILVCKDKQNKNYFFPGGHVELGEFSEDALLRELKEEISFEVDGTELMGLVENIYPATDGLHHEINLFYYAKCNKIDVESNEDHLDFFLFNKKEFLEKDIRPLRMKEVVLDWIENKKFFHIKNDK
jgi:ADP-ribose pyrophosphatase YjhB (NUDIX family)